MSTYSNRVLVVILNYRVPELTIKCLHSLVNEVHSLIGTEVIVVDNASGDDSVQQIQGAITQNAWEDWATVIASDYNGGYAYGNNFAIRPTLNSCEPPAYYLLLNPDTEVRPGALKVLVDFLEKHPTAGVAGASVENQEGQLYPIVFRFPTLLGQLEAGLRLGFVSKLLSQWTVVKHKPIGDEPIQVDWVSGGSMMIRRQVFESIGLMDEGYFLYYEETDFCLQAKRNGWTCWDIPKSRVMHIGGQSTGLTQSVPQKRRRHPQYWFDSRRRYFLKNHGWFYAVLAEFAFIFGFALWRLRRIIQRKPDYDPPQFLADSIRNLFFLLTSGLRLSQ